MTLQNIKASLLDDLRNATEFYKCEQSTGNDCASAEATEWLRTAALNLGEALIKGHGESEVPHA